MSTSRFFFDSPDAWAVSVPCAPKFETYAQYFDEAVPLIAQSGIARPISPCVVVARVTSRVAAGRRTPAGPKDRAKGLMDALHDDRRKGPKYRDLGAVAPLPDDDPDHVVGLAVEVVGGSEDAVTYRLGASLEVAGELHCSPIDVAIAAPNDIDESARLAAPRREFAEAVARAVATTGVSAVPPADGCLVIRHHPQRDEDNTWATWIAGLVGRSAWSRPAWPNGSPFQPWAPLAIASVAEPSLPCPVRYEIYKRR